jgi:hypothetical protein
MSSRSALYHLVLPCIHNIFENDLILPNAHLIPVFLRHSHRHLIFLFVIVTRLAICDASQWADGSQYTGLWLENKREGHGVMRYACGDVYDGNWVEDERQGSAAVKYASGDLYVGMFQLGKRHGYGTYTWADGNKYEGMWDNDVRTGLGTFTWTAGHSWKGIWKNDAQTYEPFTDEHEQQAKAQVEALQKQEDNHMKELQTKFGVVPPSAASTQQLQINESSSAS